MTNIPKGLWCDEHGTALDGAPDGFQDVEKFIDLLCEYLVGREDEVIACKTVAEAMTCILTILIQSQSSNLRAIADLIEQKKDHPDPISVVIRLLRAISDKIDVLHFATRDELEKRRSEWRKVN